MDLIQLFFFIETGRRLSQVLVLLKPRSQQYILSTSESISGEVHLRRNGRQARRENLWSACDHRNCER